MTAIGQTTNSSAVRKPRQRSRFFFLAICAGVSSLSSKAQAVITFGGSGSNTSAFPGNVANYEGIFNAFYTGTPISSTILATATHLTPGTTTQFVYNNGGATATTYAIQQAATLDDLALWQIAPNQTATFSNVAPIYTGNTEIGSSIVDAGRGYTRGAAIPGGWSWDNATGQLNWGANTIASVDTNTQLNTAGAQGGDYLQFNFTNQDPLSPTYNPNEAIITPFDSGGGLFINVGGQYQLAGVNSMVDSVTDSAGNAIQGSLYNTNGYYATSLLTGAPTLITTSAPENSYAVRISSKQNFVGLVDGTIPASQAAQYPISDDGLLAVYSNLTLGAVTGGASLQVGSSVVSATLKIAPNSGTSILNGLNIYRNSTLDITNNAIIINGAANTTTEAWILHRLASGYNNGLWNGAGISSSTAAQDPGVYGVGFVTASDPGVTGLTIGQAEIAYTLDGDANLDGQVNGIDFAIIVDNFNKAAPDGWADGDFNYDGSVNGADLALFGQNFNTGVNSHISSADLQVYDTFIADNGLAQDVPEPSAAIPVIAIAALCAAGGHRKLSPNR